MYLPGKSKQAQGRRLTALQIAKELEEPINRIGATFDTSRTIDSPQDWNKGNPIGTSVIVTRDDQEMKTSINLPDVLVSEIQLWNKDHPDKQIGVSGTCRKALQDALARARASDGDMAL